MKMKLLLLCLLGTFACRTNSADRRESATVTPLPPMTSPTQPTSPGTTTPTTPITPGVDKHILCQIRMSDDRSDYPEASSEQIWKMIQIDVQNHADQGYLCYKARGSNLAKLEEECLSVGQKLRKIPNSFPIKAFVVPADADTFCKDDKFSSPNERCTCNKAQNNTYYSVVGNEIFGDNNQSLCTEAFSFCGLPTP